MTSCSHWLALEYQTLGLPTVTSGISFSLEACLASVMELVLEMVRLFPFLENLTPLAEKSNFDKIPFLSVTVASYRLLLLLHFRVMAFAWEAYLLEKEGIV